MESVSLKEVNVLCQASVHCMVKQICAAYVLSDVDQNIVSSALHDELPTKHIQQFGYSLTGRHKCYIMSRFICMSSVV
jgi:hypothetical protein